MFLPLKVGVLFELIVGTPKEEEILRNLNSTLITLSSQGIVRSFNFSVPVLKNIFPTNKQNLQFLKIFSLQINKEGPRSPVALISSGDEDIILSEINLSPFSFGELSIFKRNSFAKILSLEIVENKNIICLLETGQVEVLEIMEHSSVLKKYKRKKQRNVKNLPEPEVYVKQPGNYLISKERVKLDYSVNSLKVDSQRIILKSKKQMHNIYFFSTKNFYLKANLSLSDSSNVISKINKTTFGHEGAIKFSTLSSDDAMLFSGSKDACFLWETDDCTLLKKFHLQNASCAFFLPKNKYLVIGDLSGKVSLVDVSTGDFLHSVTLIGN